VLSLPDVKEKFFNVGSEAVGSSPERFAAVLPDLSELATLAPLVLAGAGATREYADTVGARLLMGDPVTAAEQLAAS